MIIIGLGYKMQHGKDTACQAIIDRFGGSYDIRRYAFADALRVEVEHARWAMNSVSRYIPGHGFAAVCNAFGIPFDSNAPVDPMYPYGKQRALLQYWGVMRREQDPDYWVRKVDSLIFGDAPEVAIISDVRFLNELEYVERNGFAVRLDRPGFKPEKDYEHISETELDSVPASTWYDVIEATEVNELKAKAEKLFEDILIETRYRESA